MSMKDWRSSGCMSICNDGALTMTGYVGARGA